MRLYEPEDFKQVAGWFRVRGLGELQRNHLPDVGYIEEQVACGFLIQTELPYAILDFFITNPEAGRRRRYAALDAITSELLRKARFLECKAVRASSQINSIESLAKRHGFRAMGDYALFLKEL